MAFEPLNLTHEIRFVRIRSIVILELVCAKKKTYSQVTEDRFRRMCPEIPSERVAGRARVGNTDALNIFGKRTLN